MRQTIGFLLALAGAAALASACPSGPGEDDDADPGDDDTTHGPDDDADDDDSGDDDSADDDSADDDTTDDDPCGDDDTVAGWPEWQEATVGDADASFVGEATLDWAGCHLEMAGDLNGDGIDDVAIGARDNDEGGVNAGKLYLLLGQASGWALDTPISTLPSVVGDFDDLELGHAYRAGDVNGDGLADLFLKPQHESADDLDHQYLLLGRTTGWIPSLPLVSTDAWTTDTNQLPGYSGLGISREPGDVDGDGLDDWLLTSHWTLDGQGQGVVVSGAAASGEVLLPMDALGWVYGDPDESVQPTSLGDVNGDGLADIAAYPLGGPLAYSYVDILLGRPSGYPHDAHLAAVADHRYQVDPACGLLDYNLVGDLNADGYEDLAINVRSDHGHICGGIHLYFGGSGWPAVMDMNNSDVHIAPAMETHMAEPIGDINADGIDDMAFRAPGAFPDEDTDVYLLFGHAGAWPAQLLPSEADVHIRPSAPLIHVAPHGGGGYPTGAVDPKYRGDIDGDGITDLILVNWDDDTVLNGVPGAGIAMVFAGRPCWPSELETADADASFVGDVQWQNMGYRDQMGLADVNGDGKDDLLFSSFYHPIGTQEGQVFVFFGRPRTP